jgi:hypothetical protein
MAVVKLNKYILVGVLSVAVIGIILMIGVLFSSGSSNEGIILSVLKLKDSDSSVQKAQLISDIDDLVVSADNNALTEQWEHVTECLATSCPDDAFFDTVFIIVNEFPEIPNSELILNVIYVNRYWDSEENVVEFSRSLSFIDKGIPELENRNAERAWEDIVECNDACEEKNDLYFDLIEKIVLTP